ncbi:hypothetical protein N0V82_004271 [Gnomoniopsis sp. IMI 355080]|nr:hypothetical protein N0V82_004271 [Gnomoniopsis sp. IMI 355080]
MRYTPYQDDSERKRRHLHLRRASSQSNLRRVSSHSALRASFDTYSLRLAPSSKQLRRPASTANLKASAAKKERHFNQKYADPDKLFIVYCKEDLKKGWPEILALRLKVLPILLGNDYDASVEEKRKISGLTGMFYREDDLQMPVLTPDGSGLEFIEKDGRWWECIRSQKCRDRASKKPNGSDTRPRGMVERYPEEVLKYWDKHVQHFVPQEKRDEVLSRAIRYSRIRAEQRKRFGVPQWELDNKEDRRMDITPGRADESLFEADGKTLVRPIFS